jgi:spore germination protein YaaH
MAYYYAADQAADRSLRSNLARLDIVAPHWLTVDETGKVRARVPPAAVPILRSSRALILPCVMVTDRAAGHAILTDPAISATAIENLLAAVSAWDGLALDFEGLDPADRPDLTRFIHQLGAALAAAGKTYAIALPAKTQDTRTGWSGAYDYRAIAGAADLYLVMAYGYAVGSSPPGSTAPINWVNSSMAYAVSEIPPERLILGIPFYGYDWNVTQGPPARALRYDQVQELLEASGAVPQLDPRTGSRTFRYESNSDLHEVWYEDASSLTAKLELVARYRLAGVGAWRLGQEDPAFWPVWDAMLGRAPSAGSDGRSPRAVAGRGTVIYPW